MRLCWVDEAVNEKEAAEGLRLGRERMYKRLATCKSLNRQFILFFKKKCFFFRIGGGGREWTEGTGL